MFSKGTYSRYLFEIDETHRKMLDVYRRLENQIQEPQIRKILGDFAHDVEAEQRIIEDLRGIVQNLT